MTAITWFLLNGYPTIHWYFTIFFLLTKIFVTWLHRYGFSPYLYALVFYHSLIPYKCVTLAANICFSSVCFQWCLPDFSLGKRQWPYWLNKYDFSLICIPWSYTSFWFQVKAFSHLLQWYSFSPVCLSLCSASVCFCVKYLSH